MLDLSARKCTTEHLFSLSDIFQVVHQSEIAAKSDWRCMLSSREEMGIRHLASSANSKMFEKDSDVDRSFMKMITRVGQEYCLVGHQK